MSERRFERDQWVLIGDGVKERNYNILIYLYSNEKWVSG